MEARAGSYLVNLSPADKSRSDGYLHSVSEHLWYSVISQEFFKVAITRSATLPPDTMESPRDTPSR